MIVGSVLREHPNAISTDEVELRRRSMTERRGVRMARSRFGGVNASPSGHPSAPREIGILVVREERLVEAADVIEHLSAIGREGATSSKDVGRISSDINGAADEPL